MPVECIVSNEKFFNQMKNGAAYSANTSVYTQNLVGNVGDKILYTFDTLIRWYLDFTSSLQVTVSGTSTILTRNYGSWFDDGFSIGDSCYFGAGGLGTDLIVITAISETTLYYTGGSLIIDDTYTTGTIYGYTQLTAINFKPNLINNNELFNVTSKVSGNDCSYYASGISTSFVNFTKSGIYSDFVSGNKNRVKFIAYSGQYQKFSFEYEFIITPFFLESFKTNLDNSTIPDLYNNLNSLKLAFECDFLTILSNPNTKKTVRYDSNLGSTGWFNENFNGFNNLYSIDSVVLKDSNDNVISSLLTNYTNKFEVTVNGSFNSSNNVGVVLFACPKQSSYTNTTTTLEENFVFDNAITAEGGSLSTGYNSILDNVEADIVAGKMVIKGQIEFTSAQIALIKDLNYVLGVTVANGTLSSSSSDKVTLIADYNAFSLGNLYPLCGVDEIRIFQHPENIQTAEGSSSVTAWNEDGLIIKMPLKLDISKEAFLNTLEFSLIAYKDASNYFILDNFVFNFEYTVVSGVQMINYADVRGYSLTDEFNDVFLSYVSSDTDYHYYEIQIGQKISWKDWIKNINADTIFYDNTKTNNNLNYKASNYSNLNGYDIKFVLTANCTGLDENGLEFTSDFNYISPDQNINDYEENNNWTAEIKTKSVDGAVNYGGVIRTDKDTLIETTFTRISDFRTGYNFWAVQRIEESLNNSVGIYELSSVLDSVSNNILKPVSDETYLKLVIDDSAKTVVTTCLIDYAKLDISKTYKLSTRLDDGLCSGMPTLIGRLVESGDFRLDEDGNIRIIE